MSKEALVIVLDVGRSMSQSAHLEAAKRAVALLIQMKIRYKPKDEVALLLIGTKETKNHMNDKHPKEYRHITTASPLENPTLELFRSIEAIAAGSRKSNVIDGIIIAADMIIERVQKRKYTKRIFVVTDAGSDIAQSNQNADDYLETLNVIIEPIKDHEIAINIIGVDFAAGVESAEEAAELLETLQKPLIKAEAAGDSSANETEAQIRRLRNELLLRRICEAVGGGVVVDVQQAIATLGFFRGRAVQQRPSWKGLWQITGDLRIPVVFYKKTGPESLPRAKKISALALNSEDATSTAVNTERVVVSADNPDEEIDGEQRLRAYRYGKNIVPVNDVNNNLLKLDSTKGLLLIGFTDADRVPRHHYMKTSYCVCSAGGDESAARALRLLIRAMAETNRVAIVRYVFRDGTEPQLAVMAPYLRSEYECLYFNTLPFSEDLRQYPFRSFADRTDGLTPEQLAAADALIDSMDLMSAANDVPEEADADADDSGEREALKAKQTYNPAIQHFYDTLHNRALHPSANASNANAASTSSSGSGPQPLDSAAQSIAPAIARYCFPEAAPDSFYTALIQSLPVQNALQSFNQHFPVRKIEKLTSKFEKKTYWFAKADGTDSEITLDSYQQQRPEGAETSAEGGKPGYEADVSVAENALPEKDFDNDVDIRDIEAVSAKMDMLPKRTWSVGSVNPVQDFRAMFERRDEDLVDRAIAEMCAVIEQLVRDSIGAQYYEKAIGCIRALRTGCLQEDESAAFNDFLRRVKALFAHGPRRDFWLLLRDTAISLIDESESDDSDITFEQAARFLEDDEPMPAADTAPAPATDKDEEDLFDQLE